MSCHSGPTDVLGRRLRAGDKVRVVGVPALAGASAEVQGFDERGYARLVVLVDGEPRPLTLEPGLLEWTA